MRNGFHFKITSRLWKILYFCRTNKHKYNHDVGKLKNLNRNEFVIGTKGKNI